MKKNKMMRLASAMMVLTLMTTSVISGTFAKYVTSDSATDRARVAKWGVEVVATDNSMFSHAYKGTGINSAKDTVFANGGVVTDYLVAPGTSRDAIELFSLTGTPEVAVKIEVKIEDTTKKDVFLKEGTYADMTTGAVDDFTFSGDYHPVVFTLTSGTGAELKKGSLSDIEDYFENVLSKDFVEPNTDLATIETDTNGVYKLSWAWDFPETPDDITDKKDTLLGNLAADKTVEAKGSAPSFTALTEETEFYTELNFEVSVTVTQID